MELDLQSLFGLLVHSCTLWLLYEGAIGQPRWMTSLCDLLIVTYILLCHTLCIRYNQSSEGKDLTTATGKCGKYEESLEFQIELGVIYIQEFSLVFIYNICYVTSILYFRHT